MPPMMPPPPGGMHGRPLGPRGFLTEEEKQNKPEISAGLLKRIALYMKPYVWQFALVFVTLAVSAVLGLFPSVITGWIVDEIVSLSASVARLVKLVVLAFVVLGLSQVISVTEQYINSWISQKIIYDMKNQMYGHLQSMSQSFFTSQRQGDIVTRMNSDINGVSSVISNTLTSFVSNILVVGTSVVYLFVTDWRLALVSIVVMPFMILPTNAVGKKRWTLASKAQEKSDVLNQQIEETLSVSGSLLVKLYNREKREFEKFKEINNEVTKATIKEQRTGSWFHVFMGIFMQISPLLIYFAGGMLIIKSGSSSLTIGDISVAVALTNRLYFPVKQILDIQVDFVRSMALFSRIFEFLDMPVEIKSPENPDTFDFSNTDIEFDNVHFCYNPGKPIIKGVSFKIPSGKMYAIVGASGAGKSTIISLIPRLYDVNNGGVLIGGHNVKNIDLSDLRSNVGLVSQDTYLFNGTILENLLYAKPGATIEEINHACKVANIYDFITNLPEGYNTQVGNRGLKLSGGEKQRLSIARVVLKDPKILILDEATSSLDSISESLIQSALDTVMQGRTCLVIAHRLSTVISADKILVINNGIICEEGSHDELLNVSTRYKELYDTQFKKIIEHENSAHSAL